MRTLKLLSLLLVVVALQARADEKAYDVRIHRPDEKGKKFDVATAAAVRYWQRQTIGGREQDPTETLLAVELRGRVEVLDVNERGDALKVSWTVEKCTRLYGDEKEEELLPKGAVLFAEAGEDDTKLTFKGGKLTPDKEYALSLVASLASPNSATSDDLYGVKGKQKVGASWSANAEAIAKDAKRHQREIDPKDVKGTITFKGVKDIDGVEYVELDGKVAVAKFMLNDPERKSLPEGFKSTGGETETTFTAHVPTDVNLPHIRFFRVDTWKETAEGKGGRRKDQDATLESVIDSTFDIRVVPAAE